VTQVAMYLPSKHEALSSTPVLPKRSTFVCVCVYKHISINTYVYKNIYMFSIIFVCFLSYSFIMVT
jgi:hypothetical protein